VQWKIKEHMRRGFFFPGRFFGRGEGRGGNKYILRDGNLKGIKKRKKQKRKETGERKEGGGQEI
jgi:hypothetical protein